MRAGVIDAIANDIYVPGYRWLVNNFVPYPKSGSCWTFLTDHPQYDRTKLYGKPLWMDRYLELKHFYGESHGRFLLHWLRNGYPNTRYYGWRLGKRQRNYFGEKYDSPPPEELLAGYRAMEFHHANRFLLNYTRYHIGAASLELVDGEDDVSTYSVLDYGCGVADPAVYLGVLGASVTIVDLDTRLFDFATWRLDQRDIEPTAIRAEQTEAPVTLPNRKYDCIFMSEFLEHVRNPFPFLETVIAHLEDGGLFYDPVGTEFTHSLYGQHLKEAKEQVESPEYRTLHSENFEPIGDDFYRRTV